MKIMIRTEVKLSNNLSFLIAAIAPISKPKGICKTNTAKLTPIVYLNVRFKDFGCINVNRNSG